MKYLFNFTSMYYSLMFCVVTIRLIMLIITTLVWVLINVFSVIWHFNFKHLENSAWILIYRRDSEMIETTYKYPSVKDYLMFDNDRMYNEKTKRYVD